MNFSIEGQSHESVSRSKSSEAFSPSVELNNPRVQAMLATLAFDNAPDAMAKWLEEDESGVSLASRFGGLKEELGYKTPIDLSNKEQMTELLQQVQAHTADSTLH